MDDQEYKYIVYLYCDYRKEVDIQFLKIFSSREKAIEFAKKYSNDVNLEREYVSICGSEYDASFYESADDEDTDEERERVRQQMLKELSVKNDMWYLRIAVDKVPVDNN